jgi:alpha-ribazole phosphatase
MSRVILVRHPPVTNPKGLCYGRSDIPLADNWRAMLPAAPPWSPAKQVFSSPSPRCQRLAAAWFGDDRSITIDERLAEWNFGHWEQQTWEAIGRQAIDWWNADVFGRPLPGGESFQHVLQRAVSFCESHIVPTSNRDYIVITHGGLIKALLCYLFQLKLNATIAMDIPFARPLFVDLISTDKSPIRGCPTALPAILAQIARTTILT